MKGWLSRRFVPAVLASFLCCLITAYLAASIRSKTGMFVYPLDDSYIHLALARTFAEHHVWGIGPAGFASASSSPGWTLILAGADLFFGSHLTTPVFINLAFAIGVLFLVTAVLESFAPQMPFWARLAAPLVLVVGTPLPSLALIGMEHVAQTFSVLLLLWTAARILALDPNLPVGKWRGLALLGAAGLAGSLRYEAVFAVAPVFPLLLARRRFVLSFLLGICAAAGPVAFALYSYRHSGYLLPFSVMVKVSQAVAFKSRLLIVLSLLVGRLGDTPFAGVVALGRALRPRRRSFWEPVELFLTLVVAVCIAHLLFAPVGWLMRYDGYLVCLLLLCVFLMTGMWARRSPGWLPDGGGGMGKYVVPVIFVLLSLVSTKNLLRRMYNGIKLPVEAAVDRYDEHIQMARFVAKGYDRDTIVLDDIGAVAFYTHARILDLVGLGSVEPLLPARQGRRFTAEDMRGWAASENATIAILQEEPPKIREWTPPAWTLVQVWRQPRNLVFEDLTTSVYAIKPTEVPRLCGNLSSFSLAEADRVTFDACKSRGPAGAASTPPRE